MIAICGRNVSNAWEGPSKGAPQQKAYRRNVMQRCSMEFTQFGAIRGTDRYACSGIHIEDKAERSRRCLVSNRSAIGLGRLKNGYVKSVNGHKTLAGYGCFCNACSFPQA
eukprot:6176827-Pleurochrysis_carterae.AAC.3